MATPAERRRLADEIRKNPEKALTLELEDDVLLELQKELDPYARVVGHARDARRPRVVAASYTNLTEDYIRRFTMTGMVAFLFRMLDEHKVESAARRWTPAKAPAPEDPFELEDIEKRAVALTELAAVLREKAAKVAEAKAACDEQNEKLTFTEEEFRELKSAEAAMAAAGEKGPSGAAEDTPQGKMEKMQRLLAEHRDAQDEFQGVRYVTTLEMRNMGVEADQRIGKTEEEAKAFKKTGKAISESPDRHRGLLPRGQQEMPEKQAMSLIRQFLAGLFEYNPDSHVRKAYDEVVIGGEKRAFPGLAEKVLVDPYDPDRIPLNALLKEAPPTTTVAGDQPPLAAMIGGSSDGARQRDYNTICRLLDNESLAGVARYVLGGEAAGDAGRVARWRRMLLPTLAKEVIPAVPPQDTFHRWGFYLDANMEAIRAATESIYHEKAVLDFAIQVMDSFEGTEEEVKAWGESFRDKNQDLVVSEIKILEMGGWTLMGEFERNRQIANVFNSQTEILKRILDRHEADKKFGKDLMHQRVKKQKAKNIAEAGPDAPGLSTYKDTNPAPGATEVLTPLEKKRLERAKGDVRAADELRYYEQYEARSKELELKARLGALTAEEKGELENAHAEMAKALEMIEVPDDAIQVDVWMTDATGAGGGTIRKSKMYTKASDAAQIEDTKRRAAALADGADSRDPASFYPEGSRDLARKAFAEGKSAPPLAAFAQDFYAAELAKERAAADAEALKAAPEALERVAEMGGSEALAARVDAALAAAPGE